MNQTRNISPIFIGGTGRSGTTIFSRILEKHNLIYSFPQELRFITDPDGLISLQNSLVDNWSFFHADKAIDRFIVLMKNLEKRYIGKYPTYSLSKIVGSQFYNSWVQNYYNSLTQYSIPNGWAGKINIFHKMIMRYLPNKLITRLFVRDSFYCSPMSCDMLKKLNEGFLIDFFSEASKEKEARFVVEHTPYNLLHFDFIKQTLPNAKLIHIYRDPRDVICSYKTKDWGSQEFLQNAKMINDALVHWETLKVKLPKDTYIEICFEQLIYDYENELKKVCSFLNIPFSDSFFDIDITKHNIGRWKTDLLENEKKVINDSFSDLIGKYGVNT